METWKANTERSPDFEKFTKICYRLIYIDKWYYTLEIQDFPYGWGDTNFKGGANLLLELIIPKSTWK